MLGNAVGSYLCKRFGEENVWLTYRNIETREKLGYGKLGYVYDPLKDGYSAFINDWPPSPDYVINCIGTIKPFMAKDPIASIRINSIFPRELANACEKVGSKLIHITTDCVYSGAKGNYTEDDPHDALDDYGKSKSLGEPSNCMVIRTSIIGEEIHKNASLLEWAKSQKGKTVNGFLNHLWNGITTTTYAKVVEKIIDNNLYQVGLSHVFSNTVNKYELLGLFNKSFNLDLTINATNAATPVDRTLSTKKTLCGALNVPSLAEQIDEIAKSR